MFAIILDVSAYCMNPCVKTSKNKKAKEMTNLCVLVSYLEELATFFSDLML